MVDLEQQLFSSKSLLSLAGFCSLEQQTDRVAPAAEVNRAEVWG